MRTQNNSSYNSGEGDFGEESPKLSQEIFPLQIPLL